jgi:DNA repair protein RadC
MGANERRFCEIKGLGRAKYAQLMAVLELSRRYLQTRIAEQDVLTSPDATRDYLKLKLYGLPYEVFACLFLDNRHRVIRYEELFRGTIDGASVHPREVVRKVMETNAAAVIFAHNHPSGVAEPSQADLRITQRLKD